MNPLDDAEARLRAHLVAHGLEAKTDAILAACHSCLRLATVPMPDADLPLGTTKFGGAPDLPEAFEWPRRAAMPLAFLAQFDLAALPLGSRLPSDGLLSFFYDTEAQPWGMAEDLGGWAVAWTPVTERLERRTPSAEPLPSCRVNFEARLSLPSHDSPFMDKPALNDDESDAYEDLLDSIAAPPPEHQLLGHPQPVQNDVAYNVEVSVDGPLPRDCEGAEYRRREAAVRDWRLLLQVDSDDALDSMWGDSGMLYFMIREDSLIARRFDEAWLALQCY